jgi:RNA polymerase sigma-70 factor (ECF subfamily)
MMSENSAAENLFRDKYGEILAALLRYAGSEHFAWAEDAVQVAFQRALEKWPAAGSPANPSGWLYAVARNALLEALRRQKTGAAAAERLGDDPTVSQFDRLVGGPAALDDVAAMILLCCNPDLSPKAQVCLTLKSACGFSVGEIARALGMQPEAVKKTITRAKAQVAADREVFEDLRPDRIADRFDLVLETLYALFNEGYAATSGETQLRREVAEEAIRLANVLVQSSVTPAPRQGELHALVALMLLQFARFDSRRDAAGLPIRLQDQDRSRWDAVLLNAGFAALGASRTSAQPSRYHLEARIAAEHATSTSFAETRWETILDLYDQLLPLKDTPDVRLARIVAVRYARGWEAALRELDALEAALAGEGGTVARSFLRHAVRADLLEAAGQARDAAHEWQKALNTAPTEADRAFVAGKLGPSA